MERKGQAPPGGSPLGKAWSPEQISKRLKVDFPDDESMRISHEAIYQALYVQGRGALKRELVACLRTGRALRVPRSRSQQKAWAHVTPEVMISERPAEADDRAVPGHWEGDLIIGLERSAIGTLVERTTRFTMLIHLPREEGYRHKHTPKNGPALAGYGAVTMKEALAAKMTTLPEQLLRSLTWDRGKELSQHASSMASNQHALPRPRAKRSILVIRLRASSTCPRPRPIAFHTPSAKRSRALSSGSLPTREARNSAASSNRD